MGELVKWHGQNLNIDGLVEKWRKTHRIGAPPPVLLPLPSPAKQPPEIIQRVAVTHADYPPVIELPRDCSVYDGETWLARYIWHNGAYEFNTSVKLTRQQQRRYAPESVITLPDIFHTDIEQCACCGTWTPDGSTGSVCCDNGHYACYGRTSLTGYFRCRESCGGHGQLHGGEAPKFGVTPGRGRGGNFGTKF